MYPKDEIDKMWDRFYNQKEPNPGFLARRGLRLTERGDLVLGVLVLTGLALVAWAFIWIVT